MFFNLCYLTINKKVLLSIKLYLWCCLPGPLASWCFDANLWSIWLWHSEHHVDSPNWRSNLLSCCFLHCIYTSSKVMEIWPPTTRLCLGRCSAGGPSIKPWISFASEKLPFRMFWKVPKGPHGTSKIFKSRRYLCGSHLHGFIPQTETVVSAASGMHGFDSIWTKDRKPSASHCWFPT